jgi:hypothetical protein
MTTPDMEFWITTKERIEYLTSFAVGFPVEVYWCASANTGVGEDGSYLIMPECDEQGGAFWDWHLDNNEQFFATPIEAAAAFVKAFAKFPSVCN